MNLLTSFVFLLGTCQCLAAVANDHRYARGVYHQNTPTSLRNDDSCQYAHNYDIIGDEYLILLAPDVSGCCTLCAADSRCNAAVFEGGECELHSSRAGLIPSLGPVVALVKGAPGPSPPPSVLPTDTPSPEPTHAPYPPGKLPCIPFDTYTPPPGAPPLKSPGGGGGCACAEGDCNMVTPTFNWIFTACKSPSPFCINNPTDDGCACARNNMLGPSVMNVNYVAAYQLAPSSSSPNGWSWQFAPQASLNLQLDPTSNTYKRKNNSQMVFDSSTKRNDFANMPTEQDIFYGNYDMNHRVVNSISGGGGAWDVALFPYNTTGLKPPGMLYVFSGRLQGAAWFVLNQATLNRGPNVPTCHSENNCWSTGSAGELDFLESPNLFGGQKQADTESARKMWATNYNGAGRCFNQNVGQGAFCHPDGFCGANALPIKNSTNGPNVFHTNYFNQGAGGPYSLYSYNYDDGEEHVWAAVVDFRGVTIYKDADFAGLSLYTAAAELTQLAPNINTAFTAGACGDPTIYNDLQLDLPCVIYLASAPLFVSQQQWDAAVSLVPPEQRHPKRYAYPGAETIANFWKTGAMQCNSEVWWNLFMDTNQIYAPPAIYGVVYTSSILSSPNQPIVVPGINLRPWDDTSKWTATIVQSAGGYHSVTKGSLDTTCIPGRGSNLLNCPYSTQSMWHPATVRLAPQGTNADLCGNGVGCCLDCTLEQYQRIMGYNSCPNPCTAENFPAAIQLPGHNGCAPTMPACPHVGEAAQCGNMGPYSFPPPNGAVGINQCVVPGFPCNATMCTTVVGPQNFPFPHSP